MNFSDTYLSQNFASVPNHNFKYTLSTPAFDSEYIKSKIHAKILDVLRDTVRDWTAPCYYDVLYIFNFLAK